jgi:biotin carboxylase
LEKLHDLGFRVVLVSSNRYANKPSTAEAAFVDALVEVDTGDEEAVIAAALRVAEQADIAAVLSLAEIFTPLAARVAETLGVRTMSEAATRTARNKLSMRQALRDAGVNVPGFFGIHEEGDIERALSAVPLPNIIKPADQTASMNVSLNHTAGEVAGNYRRIAAQAPIFGFSVSRVAVLEDYVDGTEYSVETITCDGATTVIAVTEKEIVGGNNFVEVGHVVPARIDGSTRDRIHDTVKRTIAALGIELGVCHTELKIDSAGGIFIIEVNPRPAGDRITELVELATGVDLWSDMFRIYSGQTPSGRATGKGYAGIKFITCEPGEIHDIVGVAQAAEQPGVVDVKLHRAIGDRVESLSSSHDRVGEIVAFGDSRAELDATLDAAMNTIRISTRPVPGAGQPPPRPVREEGRETC